MNFGRKIKTLIIVAAVVTAGGLLISAQSSDFRVGKASEVLINLLRDVSMFYVEDVQPEELMKRGAEGMLSGLDPYTEFLSEDDMVDFEIMTTGKYGGIGSLIRQKGEWTYIAEPYKGFPADKAGLRIGDKIVEIDGTDVQGFESSKVSSLLKGDPGTSFSITVEQFPSGERKTIELTRERIVISGVPYYGFVSDSVGYIKHSDFTEDCSSDLRNAFMEMRKTGRLKGLILDYRGNGGGILQEAVKILSMFVPKGTEVVTMKGRTAESTKTFRTETEPLDLEIPIVVLVGNGSASASEIVSGALQDLDRGVLVGQRTFGKGLVQSTRSAGYNNYVKITTAKYYIPSGRCIQAIDYAHRNEDGSVAHVPDSLIREFTTAAGRKVYDGGGVMPDVKTDPQYISRFTIITYGKGYIDDFTDLYVQKYPAPVDPGTFSLSDADYRWFVEFMQDKDVEYESETSLALELLKQKAERERYTEQIADAIKQIESGLKDDKSGNLELYRDQLSELIEDNIILRSHYRQGVTQHNLLSDRDVKQAVALLDDAGRYGEIITSQDTDKK